MQFRAPTDAEIAAIYASGAEHLVAEADGRLLGWISFRPIECRVWGLFGMLDDATAQEKRRMFYAFRQVLRGKDHAIHVAANDHAAERLLHLLGLTSTEECYAGKRIWKWIPEHSS